jgi:hypothetical protein
MAEQLLSYSGINAADTIEEKNGFRFSDVCQEVGAMMQRQPQLPPLVIQDLFDGDQYGFRCIPYPNLAILNRHLQLHGPLTQRLQRFGDFGIDLKDL